MKIETEITRADLLKFNIFVTAKRKSTWVTIIIVWILFFFSGTNWEEYKQSIYLWLLITLMLSFSLYLVVFTFRVATSVLTASESVGNLGKHKYTITEEGLLEETQATNILTKWPAIPIIYKSNKAIYIPFTRCLYHIIPKRCFDDEKHYIEFYNNLCTRIKQHITRR